MDIHVRTIPHSHQRYPTTGDWEFDGPTGDLFVCVSAMSDWRYEFLVGIHEVIEAVLCKQAGIAEEDVSAFDVAYENARPDPYERTRFGDAPCGCTVTAESEPGDDKHAPYYVQHQIATGVERVLAAILGVSWMEYEAANLALYDNARV